MKTSLLVLCAAAIVATPPLQAQELSDWREDLRVLSTELPVRHKNAFARITSAQWTAAVNSLDARLPQLKRHEIIVEFMRLVAMVRDGHTAFAPEFDERVGFHRLPIQLYDFKDGLFIVSADSAHRDIVGAKVTMIGPSPVDAAVQAVSRIISNESPNWVRARAASLLAIPEVLAALGIGRDTLTAEFTIELDGGQKRSVVLTGAGSAAGNPHMAFAQQVDMRRATPGDDPLYMQHAEDPFWFTILPDRTLYIGYRAVVFFANGMLNEEFFRRAFAAGDSAKIERVVLDIRNNGGGNNTLNRFLAKEIIRRPALDQANKCQVLIGRGVFSAAQSLVNELDFYTGCTFVGEPTGNAPNQYGDARPLELPRSHFRVLVSSLLWQSHNAADDRGWFQPDVYVETSSADYKAKQDPVLATALRRASGPGLASRLEASAESGDTVTLLSRIDGYRYNSENKYRDIEADINAAGYQLLRDGNVPAAIGVFQMNVKLYPRSANVYDSLGEALERADKKEEAITNYRKALSLNPDLRSSRDALRRLNATP